MLADDPSRRTALALPSAGVIACLADAVQGVLEDDGYRRRADGVARAMRTLPPVDKSVELLRALAARGTDRVSAGT